MTLEINDTWKSLLKRKDTRVVLKDIAGVWDNGKLRIDTSLGNLDWEEDNPIKIVDAESGDLVFTLDKGGDTIVRGVKTLLEIDLESYGVDPEVDIISELTPDSVKYLEGRGINVSRSLLDLIKGGEDILSDYLDKNSWYNYIRISKTETNEFSYPAVGDDGKILTPDYTYSRYSDLLTFFKDGQTYIVGNITSSGKCPKFINVYGIATKTDYILIDGKEEKIEGSSTIIPIQDIPGIKIEFLDMDPDANYEYMDGRGSSKVAFFDSSKFRLGFDETLIDRMPDVLSFYFRVDKDTLSNTLSISKGSEYIPNVWKSEGASDLGGFFYFKPGITNTVIVYNEFRTPLFTSSRAFSIKDETLAEKFDVTTEAERSKSYLSYVVRIKQTGEIEDPDEVEAKEIELIDDIGETVYRFKVKIIDDSDYIIKLETPTPIYKKLSCGIYKKVSDVSSNTYLAKQVEIESKKFLKTFMYSPKTNKGENGWGVFGKDGSGKVNFFDNENGKWCYYEIPEWSVFIEDEESINLNDYTADKTNFILTETDKKLTINSAGGNVRWKYLDGGEIDDPDAVDVKTSPVEITIKRFEGKTIVLEVVRGEDNNDRYYFTPIDINSVNKLRIEGVWSEFVTTNTLGNILINEEVLFEIKTKPRFYFGTSSINDKEDIVGPLDEDIETYINNLENPPHYQRQCIYAGTGEGVITITPYGDIFCCTSTTESHDGVQKFIEEYLEKDHNLSENAYVTDSVIDRGEDHTIIGDNNTAITIDYLPTEEAVESVSVKMNPIDSDEGTIRRIEDPDFKGDFNITYDGQLCKEISDIKVGDDGNIHVNIISQPDHGFVDQEIKIEIGEIVTKYHIIILPRLDCFRIINTNTHKPEKYYIKEEGMRDFWNHPGTGYTATGTLSRSNDTIFDRSINILTTDSKLENIQYTPLVRKEGGIIDYDDTSKTTVFVEKIGVSQYDSSRYLPAEQLYEYTIEKLSVSRIDNKFPQNPTGKLSIGGENAYIFYLPQDPYKTAIIPQTVYITNHDGYCIVNQDISISAFEIKEAEEKDALIDSSSDLSYSPAYEIYKLYDQPIVRYVSYINGTRITESEGNCVLDGRCYKGQGYAKYNPQPLFCGSDSDDDILTITKKNGTTINIYGKVSKSIFDDKFYGDADNNLVTDIYIFSPVEEPENKEWKDRLELKEELFDYIHAPEITEISYDYGGSIPQHMKEKFNNSYIADDTDVGGKTITVADDLCSPNDNIGEIPVMARIEVRYLSDALKRRYSFDTRGGSIIFPMWSETEENTIATGDTDRFNIDKDDFLGNWTISAEDVNIYQDNDISINLYEGFKDNISCSDFFSFVCSDWDGEYTFAVDSLTTQKVSVDLAGVKNMLLLGDSIYNLEYFNKNISIPYPDDKKTLEISFFDFNRSNIASRNDTLYEFFESFDYTDYRVRLYYGEEEINYGDPASFEDEDTKIRWYDKKIEVDSVNNYWGKTKEIVLEIRDLGSNKLGTITINQEGKNFVTSCEGNINYSGEGTIAVTYTNNVEKPLENIELVLSGEIISSTWNKDTHIAVYTVKFPYNNTGDNQLKRSIIFTSDIYGEVTESITQPRCSFEVQGDDKEWVPANVNGVVEVSQNPTGGKKELKAPLRLICNEDTELTLTEEDFEIIGDEVSYVVYNSNGQKVPVENIFDSLSTDIVISGNIESTYPYLQTYYKLKNSATFRGTLVVEADIKAKSYNAQNKIIITYSFNER